MSDDDLNVTISEDGPDSSATEDLLNVVVEDSFSSDDLDAQVSEDDLDISTQEDSFTINVGDMGLIYHNKTSGKQGGDVDLDEFYHLSSDNNDNLLVLVGGGDTDLHYHSADRARANHTGTQLLATISDAGSMAAEDANDYLLKTGGVLSGQLSIVGGADETQLIVQAHSTQTNPLQTWANSSGVALAKIKPYGGLDVTFTTGTTAQHGLTFNITGNNAGGIGELRGITGQLIYAGSGTISNASGAFIRALLTGASPASANVSAMDTQVTTNRPASSVTAYKITAWGNASTGTLVAAYGLNIPTAFNILSGSGGVVTTAIAINIADQDAAVNNWAIKTGLGSVYFGDDVDLASGKSLTMLAGDIITDTTTGTKIGTATNQKLAFYNATPIVKQAGVGVDAASIHAALVNLGLIAA